MADGDQRLGDPPRIPQPPQEPSGPSDERVCVRFKNLTHRQANIIWIDYHGSYKNYQLLEKDQFIDVYTYARHPWMAIDDATKERLLINKEFVYLPKTLTNQQYVSRFGNRVTWLAAITAPLYSLRYSALLTLRRILTDPSNVDSLELPKQLKDELKKLVTQKLLEQDKFPR